MSEHPLLRAPRERRRQRELYAMTKRSDGVAASTEGYVFETRRIIGDAVRQLLAIQRASGGDLNGVLGRLREQEAASREAGLVAICQLCQVSEDYLRLDGYLAAASGARQPHSKTIAATLLAVCRVIQLHADAVAKTAVYLSSREVCPSLLAYLDRHFPRHSLQ